MEEQIIIKKYIPFYFDDLSELGVLFLNLHKNEIVDLQSFKSKWKPYIDEIWNNKNCLIIVALEKTDERIIAYAISQCVTVNGISNIILKEIFVCEGFRNKGIGKKLLKEIICWGKEVKANEIILKVRAGNKQALKFYNNVDFSIYNYILKRRL